MPYGDVVIYSFDTHAYLEGTGVWLDGGTWVPLAVSGDAGAESVAVLFRNGPVTNRITVRAPQRTDVFDFQPGEQRVVWIGVDRLSRGARIDVRTERGFRPADVDPASRDQRYLGVWLQGTK
jgi:hypothetical protein